MSRGGNSPWSEKATVPPSRVGTESWWKCVPVVLSYCISPWRTVVENHVSLCRGEHKFKFILFLNQNGDVWSRVVLWTNSAFPYFCFSLLEEQSVLVVAPDVLLSIWEHWLFNFPFTLILKWLSGKGAVALVFFILKFWIKLDQASMH